jgi:hypothetical protein
MRSRRRLKVPLDFSFCNRSLESSAVQLLEGLEFFFSFDEVSPVVREHARRRSASVNHSEEGI